MASPQPSRAGLAVAAVVGAGTRSSRGEAGGTELTVQARIAVLAIITTVLALSSVVILTG